MATRRSTRKVEVPISPSPSPNGAATTPRQDKSGPSTTNLNMDAPPTASNPWLPTPMETALLAIYPATLLLGSLFSTLHAPTRNSPYLATYQAYDPATAPSYFAKKGNFFNVYFVKVGWFWTTLAFFLFTFSHSSLGPPLKPVFTRRRLQATLRYAGVTLVWILVTQWCFGPPIIDRGFRWTGGKCVEVMQDEEMDVGSAKSVATHAACKAIGGQWKGGHDISGHVFLLILGSAMLWLELLPAVLRISGLREERRIRTDGGLVRSASIENDEAQGMKNMDVPEETGVGVKASLFVAGMMWWMLLMTAAYFHTWFEKFTGLLVAFMAVYAVYFLPRAVPAMRRVLGMPGV